MSGTNAWFILESDNYNLVKALIDHGEKIMYDDDGVFYDVTNLPRTLYILVDIGLNVNRVMKNGATPFLYMLNYVVSMEKEMDDYKRSGNKFHYKRIKDKIPAYYYLLELMINKGADVNATGKDGKSAMEIANQLENNRIAELLKEKGANISSNAVTKVNGRNGANASGVNASGVNASGTNASGTNASGANLKGPNGNIKLPGATGGKRKTRRSKKRKTRRT
jgi:ankyrin repeat protein